MNLEEAKKHMIKNGECWQSYTKRMDSMARETMVAEQKRLMREGHKVSTPQAYAITAQQVSGGTEEAEEGSPLPSSVSDPELEGEDNYETHCAMEGRMGRFV